MIGLLQHTAQVMRKTETGQGQVKAYLPIAVGVPCLAVPISPDKALTQGLTVGNNYTVTFDEGADIKEGDKLLVSNGLSLYISGVANYAQIGSVGHIEASCETTGEIYNASSS